MKRLFVTILLLMIAGLLYSQKIPITTSSTNALQEYKLGFALEDKGELTEAGVHYANAIKHDSTFALAHLALGMVQTNSADRRKHIANAIRHKSKASEGEQLWIMGRDAVYGTGKESEEFGYFDKLAEKYPNDEIALYLLGYMHHHHGRKNFEKAAEYGEASLRINPNYITPHNDLGYAYLEMRDFTNAERVFKRYTELLPNAAAPLDSYADMLLRSGRFRESLDKYDRVIALDPEYPWAYFGKAGNLNFLKQHAKARDVVRPLMDKKLGERDTYHVWIAMECSFLDEGKPEEAINFLSNHYTTNVTTLTFVQKYVLLTHVVRLCFEFDQEKTGLEWYKKLNEFVQRESQSETTKKSVADLHEFYMTQASYDKSSRASEAIAGLNRYAEKRGRKDDNYYYWYALVLLNDKKPTEALEMINQTDQTNPYNQYLKARCLQASKMTSEAKQIYLELTTRNETQSVDYHLVRRKAFENLDKLK